MLFYDTVLYRQQIVVIPKTEVALTDLMLLICSFNSPPQNSLELFIPVSNIILRHDGVDTDEKYFTIFAWEVAAS